jgi:heat shock protein HslJ
MKTSFKVIGAIALTLISGACKTGSDMHTSKKMHDLAGLYRGVSSSDGKETVTVLELQPDMTYTMQTATGNGSGDAISIIESNGNCSQNRAGDEITLKNAETGDKTTFKVAGNSLLKIVFNGKEALGTPSFAMQKVQKESITEKYWKLMEVNGKPVEATGQIRREPFIVLRNAGNRLTGNGGCNTFTGSYELGPANRIKFSQVVATRMFCPNMEAETAMMKIFNDADNYVISADGKSLSLNKAKMAPLARFEVVYLR